MINLAQDDGERRALELALKRSRAAAHIHDAPDLTVHVLDQVAPGGTSQTGPRVGGSKDLPINLNATAYEDAMRVYELLASWSISHARTIAREQASRMQPPGSMLAYVERDEDPTRWPGWAQSRWARYSLIADLVAWLEANDAAIADLEVAETYWDDVDDVIRRISNRYPRKPRRPRLPRRRCEACEERTMQVFFAQQVLDSEVKCTRCGHRLEGPDVTAALQELARGA